MEKLIIKSGNMVEIPMNQDGRLSYEQKKKIANTYLMKKCNLGWEDLPDVNSLHDAETIEDIKSLCDDRLFDDGFPMDLID